MKKNRKTIWIVGALGLLAVSALGAKKGMGIKSVAEQLQIKLKSIRNLQVFGSGLNIQVDIDIINPTSVPLDITTGGLVSISRIFIYDKNRNLVATATPNLSNISIGPQSSFTLDRVPVSSSFGNILNVLLAGSLKPENFKAEAEIQAFGTTFTI